MHNVPMRPMSCFSRVSEMVYEYDLFFLVVTTGNEYSISKYVLDGCKSVSTSSSYL